MTPATEPPKPAVETTAAIVHADMIRKAKTIKNYEGGSIADVLTRHGGPGINARFREVVTAMQAEANGDEPPVMANVLGGEG